MFIEARIVAVSADLMPTLGTGRDLEKRPVQDCGDTDTCEEDQRESHGEDDNGDEGVEDPHGRTHDLVRGSKRGLSCRR